MKNRIIALLLITALAFSFASCEIWTKKQNGDGENPPDKKDDFTVETEPVEYSEADVNEVLDKVEALVSDIAAALGYEKHFDDDKKEELRDTVRGKFISALIDVGIYPEELFSLLDCCEGVVALTGSETEEEINPKKISDIYTEFMSVIDVDRLGAIIYEVIMIRLVRLLENAQEKYQSKENKLNLENLNYYTALVERAEKLGRSGFTDAFSIITFSASLFSGTADIDNDGVQLSVDDAFSIIKKQAERFADLTLDATDWQAMAAVMEEFLPESGKSIKEKLLLSLNYADFFIESAGIMPELIDFYAGVVSEVSNENIKLIKDKEQYAYELCIARELLADEAALMELLSNIEEKIPASDTGCVTAINSYDKAGYLAFTEKYNATKDELVEALKSFVANTTDESYSALKDAYFGYFASINSVVTYVYIYS